MAGTNIADVTHYTDAATREGRRTILTGGRGLFANLRATIENDSIAGEAVEKASHRKIGDLVMESATETAGPATDQTMTSSVIDLTTTRKAGKTTISEISEKRTAISLGIRAGQLFGEATIRKQNQDVFALFDGFSRAIGTTNVDITMGLIFDGLSLLMQKNAPPPYYLAITPHVWRDLIDIFGVPTASLFNVSGQIVEAAQKSGVIPANVLAGFNLQLVGDLVAGTSAGEADAADAKCGMYSKFALGFLEEIPFTVKSDADINAGTTLVVAHTWNGVGELNDDWGVEMLVDNKD